MGQIVGAMLVTLALALLISWKWNNPAAAALAAGCAGVVLYSLGANNPYEAGQGAWLYAASGPLLVPIIKWNAKRKLTKGERKRSREQALADRVAQLEQRLGNDSAQ